MADFDNGLPPTDTDVTDSKIKGIVINSDEAKQKDSAFIVSAVITETANADNPIKNEIKASFVDSQETGRNRTNFL